MSLKASFAYVATRIVSGALAMATLALIVRGLGPEGYGRLTIGLAMSAAITLVLFNPLNATLARFYGEAGACLLLRLRRILFGLGLALVAIVALASLAEIAPFAPGLMLAAACMALAQGMFDFSGQHLAASLQSRNYSLQFVGKAVASLILCAAALALGLGPVGVIGAMTLAFLLAALLAGSAWRPLASSVPPAKALPELMAFAGPLLLTSLLGYLTLWGDRYLLERLVSLAELGRYSASTDLAQQVLGLLFAGMCTAWYPRLVLAWGAGDQAEAQRLYERYAALGLAVGLPAVTGFGLLLPDVLSLLYGSAYAALPPALPALITAAVALAGVKAYYLDQALLLGRRLWWHAASIAMTAACGLLLAAWLVPGMGISGAALGLLLGQLPGCALSIVGGRGLLARRCAWRLAWPSVLGCSMMALLLGVWTPAGWSGLLARTFAGALVYAAVMWSADFDGVRAGLARRCR